VIREKRINRRAGYVLKIPCQYIFLWKRHSPYRGVPGGKRGCADNVVIPGARPYDVTGVLPYFRVPYPLKF